MQKTTRKSRRLCAWLDQKQSNRGDWGWLRHVLVETEHVTTAFTGFYTHFWRVLREHVTTAFIGATRIIDAFCERNIAKNNVWETKADFCLRVSIGAGKLSDRRNRHRRAEAGRGIAVSCASGCRGTDVDWCVSRRWHESPVPSSPSARCDPGDVDPEEIGGVPKSPIEGTVIAELRLDVVSPSQVPADVTPSSPSARCDPGDVDPEEIGGVPKKTRTRWRRFQRRSLCHMALFENASWRAAGEATNRCTNSPTPVDEHPLLKAGLIPKRLVDVFATPPAKADRVAREAWRHDQGPRADKRWSLKRDPRGRH